MTFKLPSLALLATLTAAATAQTPTTPATPKKPVPHHVTTIAKPANPADNPPGVPKVVGTPKPLYSLRYVDTVIGTGPLAEPHKFYTVHYTGWLTDGTKFDSSLDHPGKEPFTFPYGGHRVIPAWDTGFQGMHVGGKRRIYVPYQLAYGETGHPPVIPAKSDLIFDIELISQSDTPPQPKPAPAPAPTPDTKPATDPTKPAPAPAPDTKPATDPTKPTTETPPTGSTAPATQPKTPPHPEGL
jgi:peptidylprolyl isomerase